jgi:hypothetical protein
VLPASWLAVSKPRLTGLVDVPVRFADILVNFERVPDLSLNASLPVTAMWWTWCRRAHIGVFAARQPSYPLVDVGWAREPSPRPDPVMPHWPPADRVARHHARTCAGRAP